MAATAINPVRIYQLLCSPSSKLITYSVTPLFPFVVVQGRLSICYYTCCSKVYFPRWMCSTRTRIVLLSLSFKSSRLCLILRAQYVRCILMWNSSRSCLISAVMTAGFSWGSLNWPVMNNKTCSDFKVSIYLVQSYHCKIVLVAPQIVFKGLYRERKRCAWRNNIQ